MKKKPPLTLLKFDPDEHAGGHGHNSRMAAVRNAKRSPLRHKFFLSEASKERSEENGYVKREDED